MQYLTMVGATYYFRRPVPDDIQAYFLTKSGEPRTDWKFSLRTKDRTTAKERCNRMASEYDDLIRATRAKLREGIKPAHAVAAPKPSGPWDPYPDPRVIDGEEEAYRLEAEREWEVENDPIQQRIASAVADALANKEAQDRGHLEMLKEDRATSRAPLMDLFDAYVDARKPVPATVKRWRPVMEHLKGFLGHDDAARITRKDVIAWRDALLSEKDDKGEPVRGALTIKETYLASLMVVLGHARENDKIKANVAADVVIRVPKKVRLRDPDFTKEEARTILKASLAPQPDSLAPEHRLARRWVPWLCAYTGARVNEMTQLRGEDVREVEGIWTLRITPEAGGVKSGKARAVPIHEHLIAQGFLDVVKAQGKGPLFYNPERGRGGSAGNPHHKKMGERLAAWVRKLGVDDPDVQPNHAWRHLFKTTARSVHMDAEARDTIQGHAMKTEGQKYGVYPLPLLAEELNKLPRFEVGETG